MSSLKRGHRNEVSSSDVRNYCIEHSTRFHPALEKLIQVTGKLPGGFIMGGPEVIQLNMTLMKTLAARKVLDIGVLTGVSAVAAALCVPEDGKVVACDVRDDYANIGRPLWKEAGVDHKIDLRIQPAITTLDQLLDNGEAGSYDFAFIDADKENYDKYFERCLRLLRPGGIISLDNTLWGDKVVSQQVGESSTEALKALNNKLSQDSRVIVSLLNISDGLTLVFKK